MAVTRTTHIGRIPFILYFILLILVPVTHCHSAEGLSEDGACRSGHGQEHLSFFCSEKCCEFHESDHAPGDEQHIHFLIDDQGIAAGRFQTTDSPLSPELLSEAVAAVPARFAEEGVVAVPSCRVLYQEAFLSYSSGLSPPLS